MGIIRNKKKAFTLAEVMIVLLVLTIIFAAMAPLITKKRTANRDEDYWNWASRGFSSPMNAQKTRPNGSIFFGATPMNNDAVTSTFGPDSKVVIRSGIVANNRIQRQLQLRYLHNAPDSIPSATILADNTNLLLGFRFINLNETGTLLQYPKNNLVIGYNALEHLSIRDNPISNSTAIGHNALSAATSNASGNTAIGYNAGSSSFGEANVFIGSNANGSAVTSYNTLIGYNALSGGINNTFIGANTGNLQASANNTAIGYNALHSITSGIYNIALGYNALGGLTSGSYNVAIGYNACSNLSNNTSNKTCIGENSGPTESESTKYYNDTEYRTFIGQQRSSSNFGGDAVLEIHNLSNKASNKLVNNPNIQNYTTTVVNGNLVVKGNTYFTIGNYLYPFTISGDFGVNDISTSICNANQRSYSFGTCGINLASDRRLKYIGSRYNSGLDEINKLQVYNYTYKNDKKKEPHTGVIAQHLQKVFPNAVSKDENGYLRIRWDEMFYACINAIKTLNQRVASLVKRTISLEDEITKLEKENSKLKAEVENISARVDKLKGIQK